MKFGPCSGIYSSDYANIPSVTESCSGIKILIKDDFSFLEYGVIYTKTMFMFAVQPGPWFAYIRFSKEMYPEDVRVKMKSNSSKII